jgi:hypothetical protein
MSFILSTMFLVATGVQSAVPSQKHDDSPPQGVHLSIETCFQKEPASHPRSCILPFPIVGTKDHDTSMSSQEKDKIMTIATLKKGFPFDGSDGQNASFPCLICWCFSDAYDASTYAIIAMTETCGNVMPTCWSKSLTRHDLVEDGMQR